MRTILSQRRKYSFNLNERDFIYLDPSPLSWRMRLRVSFPVAEHLIRKWNILKWVSFRSLFARWTRWTVFLLIWGVDSFPRCDRTSPNCGRTAAVCSTSTATDRQSSHRHRKSRMMQRTFLIKSNHFRLNREEPCNFEPVLPKLSVKNRRRRSHSSCVSMATSCMLFRAQ